MVARGAHARNVSAELLQLYQISNQQKQLLDGINSALVDGIVLTDKGGMVQYANQAFAHDGSGSFDEERCRHGLCGDFWLRYRFAAV